MKKTTNHLSKFMLAARVLALLALTFAALASPQPAGATGRCYVDEGAGGTNAGTSWTDAYTDLQSALENSSCTEIWVAEGVYKPASADSPAIPFDIIPGVAVYGGFDGTEGARTGRDPATHVTILSGDIDNDDINTDLNNIDETYNDIRGDNSDHVVRIYTITASATSTTVLDGFTITGGQMPASSSYGGGGLYCIGDASVAPAHACSPKLENLTFSGNKAEVGGALYNFGAGSGGVSGVSSPTLTNVTFHGNRATGVGGAVFNDGRNGGASSPTLTNVTFYGNSTGFRGGAIYNDGEGLGTSSPTLTNVTFSGNSAGTDGGAMYNNGSFSGASHPILKNVILWGDTATNGPEIFNNAATPSVNYSVVQGGDAGIAGDSGLTAWSSGAGNLSTDPKLGALANNGGSTQTMALLAGSSAIDTGTNSGCPATDQRGVTRPQGPLCDIGAFELVVHSLTVTSAHGTVNRNNPGPYYDGDVVQLTALPAAGWTFANWSGDATGTANPVSVTMDGDKAVTANYVQPAFLATPASWNYGWVKVATTAAGMVFTIKNTGSGNLVIGAVTLAGAMPTQFHMTANTCSAQTLIPNAICTITATFKPTTAGTKTAYINIPDNASGNPHKILLSGRGGIELALNGGFNTYPTATARIPKYWTATNFAATDGKNTAYKKEGTASVKIANTSVLTKTLTETRLISGAAGNKFRLSLWGKGLHIPTTAGVVRAQVLLYYGATLRQTATITLPNGTYGFTQKTLAFTATRAYNKIVIKLIYSKGTGAEWFDGLSLLRSP